MRKKATKTLDIVFQTKTMLLNAKQVENMKIVKLKGGLGNQMFEYAFGQAWSEDVVYDASFFEKKRNPKKVVARVYELGFFDISPKLLNKKEMKKYKKNRLFLSLFGVQTKLPVIKEEENMKFQPALLKTEQGIMDGYFQCAEYFEHIRAKLLKDFTPKLKPNKQNTAILKDICQTNSVSVHIRRGDYLNFTNIYHICNADYYQKAMDYIAGKQKNPKFFFFSEDMEWVKQNIFCPFACEYVDINRGANSVWDMWLMKNCKHNVIANSSFSWWGAWLNENSNKIVIAPKEWLVDGRTTDIVPKEWLRM